VEPSEWRTALKERGEDALSLDLYVEPGASKTGLGPYDPWRQRIKARVTAPASKGKANEELARLLADTLGVGPKDVRILRGATTRRKTVLVRGLDVTAAAAALEPVLGEGEAPG
jgi:uncharacterized protein (TIGR00251 family)